MSEPDSPPPEPEHTAPPTQLWVLSVTAEAEVIPGDPKED